MRTNASNCCCQNLWQKTINQQCNTNFSPYSIFGGGGFGCGFNSIFMSGFGGFSSNINCCGGRGLFGGLTGGLLGGLALFGGFFAGFGIANLIGGLFRGKEAQTDAPTEIIPEERPTPKTKIDLSPKFENNEDNSLPQEIKDEMLYIANDVMQKHLKTAKFEVKDLLIERVKAVITGVNISDVYAKTSGTENDYRNDDGDLVRVADGTVVTLTFEYEGREYKCKVKSDKVPETGGERSYIEKT